MSLGFKKSKLHVFCSFIIEWQMNQENIVNWVYYILWVYACYMHIIFCGLEADTFLNRICQKSQNKIVWKKKNYKYVCRIGIYGSTMGQYSLFDYSGTYKRSSYWVFAPYIILQQVYLVIIHFFKAMIWEFPFLWSTYHHLQKSAYTYVDKSLVFSLLCLTPLNELRERIERAAGCLFSSTCRADML